MSTPQTTVQRRAGPLPGPLGRIAAGVYGAIIARRNRSFDAGRKVEVLPIPVVSVGNLSVGGTGKTPMVAHLCRVLLERRIRPCIAMRGYAAGKRGAGDGGSDESDVYRREFGESVDVVAQPDRAQGILELLASGSTPPSVVILDDGFQHRQIRRDLDIVLIDASSDPFQDRLLPAGWLRETPDSLGRASRVVLTHAELSTPEQLADLRRIIERSCGKSPLPIATTRHLWTALNDALGAAMPLDWLLSKRVLGVCAIGNPRGFVDALKATLGPNGNPELIILPDHDPYRQGTIGRILGTARRVAAEAIVVTDKDWSKLRQVPASAWPCPVVRTVLSLGFVEGQAELERAVLGVIPPTPGL